MGMDVSGRNPSSKEGEYFRASMWSWRPIHALIYELCSDLISEEMIKNLGYNDGEGPSDQETCTVMASRFEEFLEDDPAEEFFVNLGAFITKAGTLTMKEELGVKSAHSIEREHLKEWVEFLKHCGGFEVW